MATLPTNRILTLKDVVELKDKYDFIISTPYITVDTSEYYLLEREGSDTTGQRKIKLIKRLDGNRDYGIVIKDNECIYIQIKQTKTHMSSGSPVGVN